MRYFIELSYDGSNFHGWQIQANAHTIQAEINEALTLLLKEKINVVGQGRTDTGVHAKQFFAHFDIEKKPSENLTFRLNQILPPSISIKRIFEVARDLHTRFSAKTRTYEYLIYQEKNPFLHKRALFVPQKLNFEAMNQAAEIMKSYKDFSCFSKSHTQVNNNFCKISHAIWTKQKDYAVFEVTANRFLRNMVRAIVGTLLEIGKEKIPVNEIKTIIESKNRSQAGVSVPAHGLYLVGVEY